MNITIHPGLLSGSVVIPSSKSFAHRLLIAAALSDRPTLVRMNALSNDIIATAACLGALGAQAERTSEGYLVTPLAGKLPEKATLFCGESGSTLRFLIPVAAALGMDTVFTGAGRLPERPNALLTEALNAHGACADSDLLPMHVSGRLRGGAYEIAGNVSSQYITGLLLALPLCTEDSEIILTTKLESASYVDITLETLKPFGITIEKTARGFRVPGGQQYCSPGEVDAEGDWSSATFWKVAAAVGSNVRCVGLNENSCQGDRAIDALLRQLGGEIDVTDTPDIVPALAIAAASHPGVTRITGAARLRLKESDRLKAVSGLLQALGGECEELADGLVIHGGMQLTGGFVEGCNDHRIVMAAAVAATAASGPVTITDSEAVNKSYPAFFKEFTQLGGKAHVESDR